MKAIDRIFQYIDYKGVTAAAFERENSLSNGYLTTQKRRGSDLGESIILRITDNCPDMSIKWLVSGKGDMINSKEVVRHNDQAIPYYNVDFTGGFDVLINDQTIVPAYYIDYPPFNNKGALCVNLTGDSMRPELNHGDTIVIKEATTPIEYLPFGEIYAIITDDFRTVKRLGRSGKDGFVKLIPTNKEGGYSEQDIPVGIIRKIFHVLGSIKNL